MLRPQNSETKNGNSQPHRRPDRDMSRIWFCPHDAFGDKDEKPSDEVAWFGRHNFGRRGKGGADWSGVADPFTAEERQQKVLCCIPCEFSFGKSPRGLLLDPKDNSVGIFLGKRTRALTGISGKSPQNNSKIF